MQGEIWEMAAGQGQVYLGADSLTRFCETLADSKRRIFVLTDSNTSRDCLPILASQLPNHFHFSLPAGESSKSIDQCMRIWEALTNATFDRGDCVINLGGGMVCDIGGFAASCYKRGIGFIHIPTTLLAMADAAIGGKTGINFQGFKNQIGSFLQPKAVVIHTPFLATLPKRELRAGYAEVLKHYLIHDRAAWEMAAAHPKLPTDWNSIVPAAVKIKLSFTEKDPLEKGIRKALNFGHTIGHAVESHFLQQRSGESLLHGEAVAVGIACEAFLSLQRGLISAAEFISIRDTLYNVFGWVEFSEDEASEIGRWCLQDKKNSGGMVNASLLQGIGGFALDQLLPLDEIEACLVAYKNRFPGNH